MNPRRAFACVAAVCLPLVLMGQGCEDQATPSSLMNGTTNITKSMRGFWDSAGGKACSWRKYDRYENQTGSGKGPVSQKVLFSTADVGGKFKSDKCALWSK